jgi:hypothetical protein
MENNKKRGWLADIYKQMDAQRKKLENKWTLECDKENHIFTIDNADSLFNDMTDDCIFNEKNDSIILGVFDTMKECVEYYNNIVKIKKDYDETKEVTREYELRMACTSSNLIQKILEKETNIKSIKQLRQTGYKVRVMHERDTIKVQTISGFRSFYNARGGSTTIQITTPEGITIEGKSRCSQKENFCRKTGNRIAMERAFQKLNKI